LTIFDLVIINFEENITKNISKWIPHFFNPNPEQTSTFLGSN
jgi:hypothetical protein